MTTLIREPNKMELEKKLIRYEKALKEINKAVIYLSGNRSADDIIDFYHAVARKALEPETVFFDKKLDQYLINFFEDDNPNPRAI